MKRAVYFPFIVVLLLTACQKNVENAYTLKFYGDTKTDIGYSVAIGHEGYIIAGQREIVSREGGNMTGTTNKQMAVIMTDWSGNIIHNPVIVGGEYDDWGSKIYQLGDGSLICVGTLTDTTVAGGGKKQVLAVKMSATGAVQWMKAYGGKGNQIGKDIVESGFGYIILGSTDAENLSGADSTGNKAGNTDLLIIKIDQNGDTIRSYPRGYSGNDEPAAIRQDKDGSFVVVGTTDNRIPNSGQAKDNIFIVKLRSSDGEPVDNNIIGTAADEFASGMAVTDNGYLISLTVKADAGNSAQLIVVPRDIHAAPVYGTPFKINNESTTVNAMATYTGGNYLLAGSVSVGTGLRMAIFEVTPEGNPVNGAVMVNGSTGDQVANDVVSGDDGYIIAVGSNTYQINSMISLLKFKF
ncbi:MAG TPA: hypothetical protein VMT63_12215 [Bacteroidales bacterium]|nr:hypothetical protein [Bacteroidales bacterium]